MPVSKISISLPAALMTFVTEKVDQAGYGSVSEYFRDLVRQDQKADYAALDSLRARYAVRSDQRSDESLLSSAEPFRR